MWPGPWPKSTFQTRPFILTPYLWPLRRTEPPTWLIWVQTAIGLLLIMVAAHFFVEDIQTLSALWSINPMVLSLLMVPIATEMPEKFNSVIWLGKHKDTLAMGNVTGAMVFQSCIPTAIGVAFTPWVLNTQGMLSVGLCFTSVVLLLTVSYLKKAITPAVLGICGAFYLVFLAYTFSIVENPALAGGG
jgi:cation:H+ antiporter